MGRAPGGGPLTLALLLTIAPWVATGHAPFGQACLAFPFRQAGHVRNGCRESANGVHSVLTACRPSAEA